MAGDDRSLRRGVRTADRDLTCSDTRLFDPRPTEPGSQSHCGLPPLPGDQQRLAPTRGDPHVVPIRIYKTKVSGAPRSVAERFDPSVVAFCLGTGEGVGTLNIINLDDDLQPDASRPGEALATEVVVSGSFV